jgi:hypothetical protein
MKAVVISLSLSVIAGEASTATRIETAGMTCAQIQSTLGREGIARLHYRSTRDTSLPLYGQYVASVRYCGSAELAATSTIPAADTPSCQVRRCVRVTREGVAVDDARPGWKTPRAISARKQLSPIVLRAVY